MEEFLCDTLDFLNQRGVPISQHTISGRLLLPSSSMFVHSGNSLGTRFSTRLCSSKNKLPYKGKKKPLMEINIRGKRCILLNTQVELGMREIFMDLGRSMSFAMYVNHLEAIPSMEWRYHVQTS